jgi:hypothetical protein
MKKILIATALISSSLVRAQVAIVDEGLTPEMEQVLQSVAEESHLTLKLAHSSQELEAMMADDPTFKLSELLIGTNSDKLSMKPKDLVNLAKKFPTRVSVEELKFSSSGSLRKVEHERDQWTKALRKGAKIQEQALDDHRSPVEYAKDLLAKLRPHRKKADKPDAIDFPTTDEPSHPTEHLQPSGGGR